MKHIGNVTMSRASALRVELGLADAKQDLHNAMWRAWWDFVYQKKTTVIS